MAAAKKEDRMDSAITTVLTAVIVSILIAYLAIPILNGALATMTGDAAQYVPIFQAMIVIMIFSVVILVVRGFNSGAR